MAHTNTAQMMREVMLQHVGRFEKTAAEIFEAFLNDYGQPSKQKRSSDRAMWRILNWLADAGCVKVEGKRYSGMAYRSTGGPIPKFRPRPIACRACGMVGANQKTHPDHALAVVKKAETEEAIREYRNQYNREWKRRRRALEGRIWRPQPSTQPRDAAGRYKRRDVDIGTAGRGPRVANGSGRGLGSVVLPEQQVSEVGPGPSEELGSGLAAAV